MKSNHKKRGGKYYFSLTRHKSGMEGYDIASRLRDAGVELNSEVRLNFNIASLSRIHGIQIKPFDFYSDSNTPRVGSKNIYNHLRGKYLKNKDEEEANEMYFDKYGKYPWEDMKESHKYRKKLVEFDNSMNDYDSDDEYYNEDEYGDEYYSHLYDNNAHCYRYWEDEDDDEFAEHEDDWDCCYDDPQYYNMAEETVSSDTIKKIPFVYKYIDTADVFMHLGRNDVKEPYLDYVDDDGNEYYDDYDNEDDSYNYAYALCKAAIGTPWESKIRVFLNRSDFASEKNYMNVQQFFEYIKGSKSYKDYSKKGRNILRRKTYSAGNIDTEYSD